MFTFWRKRENSLRKSCQCCNTYFDHIFWVTSIWNLKNKYFSFTFVMSHKNKPHDKKPHKYRHNPRCSPRTSKLSILLLERITSLDITIMTKILQFHNPMFESTSSLSLQISRMVLTCHTGLPLFTRKFMCETKPL